MWCNVVPGHFWCVPIFALPISVVGAVFTGCFRINCFKKNVNRHFDGSLYVFFLFIIIVNVLISTNAQAFLSIALLLCHGIWFQNGVNFHVAMRIDQSWVKPLFVGLLQFACRKWHELTNICVAPSSVLPQTGAHISLQRLKQAESSSENISSFTSDAQ